MTETEVVAVLAGRWCVPRETVDDLSTYARLLLNENSRQNLIAKSTESRIWDRHILDSAQLLNFAPSSSATWLDVGSGAGFPGLVLAILSRSQHILVEPRRRRAGFLSDVVAALALGTRVRVEQKMVEKLDDKPVGVITGRAVTSVHDLLARTRHLADSSTIWLLHKGRSARAEVELARQQVSATFSLLPSMTDPEAAIVKVSGLKDLRP